MNKIKANNQKMNQQGFASLVIGLVLIIVLALLTIGFAQLTRHEQQQALSKQLATQAYYAAETGINDVTQAIKEKTLVSTTSGVGSSTCLPAIPGPSGNYNNIIGPSGNNVSYQCAIVDLSTSDITYNPVPVNSARTSVTSTSSAINSMTIKWSSTTGKTTPAPGNFAYTTAWDSPAVIQFSITPLQAGLDRNSLINNTFTAYLYPSSSSSSVSYSNAAGGQGKIGNGGCVSGTCEVTITGIPGGGTGLYLIHFLDLYDSSNVTITGSDSSGSPVTFSGSQAKVDVTGKAKNVLKRLQVRVPIDSTNSLANYSIEASDICKRIVASSSAGATNFVKTDGNNAAGNDACYGLD